MFSFPDDFLVMERPKYYSIVCVVALPDFCVGINICSCHSLALLQFYSMPRVIVSCPSSVEITNIHNYFLE